MMKTYFDLHDGLSDMIEGGRLTEKDIPDDYKWLVEKLEEAVKAYHEAVDSDDAKEYREAATRLHARDGQLEIDTEAPVSFGSDPGAYIQAWVWVDKEDL